MSSFSSSTSGSTFGGRSSGSEDGMSFGSPTKHDLEGGHHLEPLNEEAKDENEPLDHPVLSSFNRDTVVSNEFGFTKMQTKSAWAKQMAAFDKLDLKKAKKEARFKKNHPVPVVEAPKGKKGKKNRFEGEEEE